MREWNTPIREPWNPLIKEALKAIDRHEALYREGGLGLHCVAASQLRSYVSTLKDWIHSAEAKAPDRDLSSAP
jgi:chromosome segregation and condensation protein ScpB